MKWTSEAQEAVKKVPFFVRKKVKAKVETLARQNGHEVVEIRDVKQAKEGFVKGMAKEIQGFRVENCFGASGCPNQACDTAPLLEKIKSLLEKEKILDFLKTEVGENIKFHHEFRVAASDCPNACSQPQIRDVGIIGAVLPGVTREPCSQCESCVDVCKEGAVHLDDDGPLLDMNRCLFCGECVRACPTGTLDQKEKGFRVQLGGCLGRHPRLALEVPGILNEEEALKIVERAVQFYKNNSKKGARFAKIMTESNFEDLVKS